jgi:hypothetical protein
MTLLLRWSAVILSVDNDCLLLLLSGFQSKRAIQQMPRFNVRDSITVIFLNTDVSFNGDFGARGNTQTPIQFSYSSHQCREDSSFTLTPLPTATTCNSQQQDPPSDTVF